MLKFYNKNAANNFFYRRMKKMKNIFSKFLLFLIAIILFAIIMSCEKQKCKNIKWYNVSIAANNSSVKTNEKLQLTVIYNTSNSRGSVHHFEDEKSGNTIRIKTFEDTEPCNICTQVVALKQAIYYFKEKKSGVYYLEFQNPENISIWDTVYVN